MQRSGNMQRKDRNDLLHMRTHLGKHMSQCVCWIAWALVGCSSEAPSSKPFVRIILGPGVTQADADRFEAAPPASDTAAAPTIDYPLAQAVMPLNAFAPKPMWTPHHTPSADDIYRIRL